MGRIIRYTLAGMLGALIGWAILEPTPFMPNEEKAISYAGIFTIGLVSGLMIGLVMGIVEGLSSFSPRDFWRNTIAGALVGAAGGILGLTFGSAFYNVMHELSGAGNPSQYLPSDIPMEARPASESVPSMFSFILLLIGRSFGWALIGGFIGLSLGAAASSVKKIINGAIGGFIGGGLGGTVFEILAWMNKGHVAAFPSPMIRFISFAITGASIGLFIGLIAEVAKKAWLVRLVGRNEGKQYEIDKPNVVIGRSEMADLMVFGDPDVAERHARITLQGQRYAIEDLGSYFGTTVNNQKITREYLRDGDTIVFGKTQFLFRDKATARSGGYSTSSDGGPRPSIPTNQHVCQFCGAVKDAGGNCDCTIGTAPGAVSAPSPVASPFDDPMQTVHSHPAQQSQPTQNIGNEPMAVPAGQGAKLVAITGPYSGQIFILGNNEIQIGREASKDIGMPTDNTVSRNHAKIVFESAGYVIYDAGSTNGTYVNNARIMQHNLTNGDVVQVGSTKFRFEVS